ncbi:MAG: hypothetical protein M3Q55_04185 [Acidobacteriota bacterium]|nr:hypothetical protein [Acidobacteriota bacterium]
MSVVARFGLAILFACALGCNSSSPTRPDDDDDPAVTNPPVTGQIVTGTAVNALTDAAAASISIATNGFALGSTAADGTFQVGFSVAAVNRITMSGPGFVERQTGVQAPAANLRLSLIPSTFDLNSFNQMFRHAPVNGTPALTRWTAPPKLLIERRVLQFTTLGAPSYTALSETLTDAEVASIIADMRDGYALLTAGRLGTFASIETRTSAEGSAVTINEPGYIVVTRQPGLTAAENYWGYARWSTTPDGAVTRGFIILDRGFERSSSSYKRSLRMHELGHTLGCNHVFLPVRSVMNSNAETEPNTFDQQAAKLAMLRPPGNRAPDIDPVNTSAATASRAARAHTWHGAR